MSDYALVTGGSRNIGRAICGRLAKDGYQVIQFDIVEPEETIGATFVRVDLADAEETSAALADVCRGRRISRLVNNVGIGHVGGVEETSLEEFEKVMRLNARTALQCTQALLPDMRAAGFGRIVNLASRAIAGIPGITAYAASKAAIVGMTRTWAMELARHGITVNAIAPGPIDTDMYREMNPPGSANDRRIREGIPVGRIGALEDIANAASFFLDARSGFVTGQVLFVCGGLSIGRQA